MKHRPRQATSGAGVPPVSGPAARRPHAFTLIELLVVISIIAVIAGIGVVVSGSMYRSAVESRTRVLLGQLAGSAIEYKEQVGKSVTWVSAIPPVVVFGTPYDSADTGLDHESINYYISAVRQNSRPAMAQLRAIDGRSYAGNGFDEGAAFTSSAASQDGTSILDGFDNPIRYYPGTDNGAPAAPTSTEVPLVNKNNAMPLRKRPYFASAGIDGEWGEINDQNDFEGTVDNDNDGQPDSKDNLYSFEVQ